MACKLEACAECTQKCLLIHGRKRNSSPVITSFFKVMIGKQFSEVLFLPPKFFPTVSSLIGQKILLEDSSGQQWEVTVSNLNGALAFKQGWNAFSVHHRLEIGDFLVFHYIMGSHFVVHIYNKTGCEKIDFSVNRNQRKRVKPTTNSTVEDGPYYATDKDSMNKQGSSTPVSSGSHKEINHTESQCEMNDVEKVIAKVISNCEISHDSPKVLSKAECFEDLYYFVDRDFGEQVENRCLVFDLSRFEMSENNCGKDKSNEFKVVDEHPQHDDASMRSQMEDVLVNKYPVVEEVVNRVVPSDASNFETIKNNNVEMMKKLVTLSGNCNSKFSEHHQFATAIEPANDGGNSSNISNGVFKRCHIAEEESIMQSKSKPEIDQVTVSQMDCTLFADIDQSVPLRIIGKSGTSSIPFISRIQNCQLGESTNIVKREPVEMTPELCSDAQMFQDIYGKLTPLFMVDCSQSSDLFGRENTVTQVVKTESQDLASTSSSTAVSISCVTTSVSQHFLELPTCLPTSFKGRFKRERMVVLLRDPDMRIWPVLYHEKSAFKILTSGWEAFSKANNIKLGDECVFGVESNSESVYGVNIVRK